MNSFKRLVGELHRRSVWQVLGVFLAASWAVVEFVAFLTEEAGLPDWTPMMALVLLLIGLPVVLATAVVQEGLPGQGGEDEAAGARPRAAAARPHATAPGPEPGPSARASADSPRSTTRRLFTWRNAILGGVGAFTLLGASIFGYFVLWTSGLGPMGNLVAQGVLEEGDAVILADFADATGQNLGDVVTEAIRVDLSESPVIQPVAPAYVTQGLARMGRPADAPFDADLARELAVRDGIKAVIQGEVAPVGSGYLLTASVVAAESGEILKAFRVPVASDDELLAGIDKLSQEIREKSGESLRSIRRGTGLEMATTSSLDALRVYTDAVRAFNQARPQEAIALLEEALELDPDFAMAWRKLAVIYSNEGIETERMQEASRRAYELRRRLTEQEAGLAEAWYLSAVQDDPEGAMDAYRRILERFPDNTTALNNLGVRLLALGRWEEAEAPLRRLAALPTVSQTSLANFISTLWNVGKTAEAEAWADSVARRFPDSPVMQAIELSLAEGRGSWGEAHELAEASWRDEPPRSSDRSELVARMAGYDLARGRWAEATGHLDQADRELRELAAPEYALQFPALMRVLGATALQGPEAAQAATRTLAWAVPDDPASGRFQQMSVYKALAGSSAEAERDFAAYVETVPVESRGPGFRLGVETHRTLVAFGAGEWTTAAEGFTRVHRELQPCGDRCFFMAEWGIALARAGRHDEALDVLRTALDYSPFGQRGLRTMWFAPALEELGRIHEERGEVEEARAAYQRIVDDFGEGDGPFRAFVQRARTRLQALEG